MVNENDTVEIRIYRKYSDENIKYFMDSCRGGATWCLKEYNDYLSEDEILDLTRETVTQCCVAYMNGQYREEAKPFTYAVAVSRNLSKKLFKKKKRSIPLVFESDLDLKLDSIISKEKTRFIFEDFIRTLPEIEGKIIYSLIDSHDFYHTSNTLAHTANDGIYDLNLSALAKHHGLTQTEIRNHLRHIFKQAKDYELLDEILSIIRQYEKERY